MLLRGSLLYRLCYSIINRSIDMFFYTERYGRRERADARSSVETPDFRGKRHPRERYVHEHCLKRWTEVRASSVRMTECSLLKGSTTGPALSHHLRVILLCDTALDRSW